MKKYLPFVILAVLVLGVIYMSKSEKPETNNVNTSNADILKIVEDDWTYGNKNAKVVVVEYLDLECEACGAYYPITTKLKEEYRNDMLFVVRYLPLPGHKNSMTAAKAAEAAGRQGKFWEMYSILFEKQGEWGEQGTTNQQQFEKYAKEIGLNIGQWQKDLNGPAVSERIKRNYDEAMTLKIQGTPTFFLNGEKIVNPAGYEPFKKVIEDTKRK